MNWRGSLDENESNHEYIETTFNYTCLQNSELIQSN